MIASIQIDTPTTVIQTDYNLLECFLLSNGFLVNKKGERVGNDQMERILCGTENIYI